MVTWKQLPAKVIMDVANLCDGHTIFKMEAFTELGVPEELIRRYAYEHESDTSDYKSTIFDDAGKIIPKLMGVYGLDVIESMTHDLGLPGSSKMGRGFRAQECREQIRNHLGQVSAQ